MIRKMTLVFAVLLLGSAALRADNIVTSRPTGTDSVNWSQLGPVGATIPQDFSFVTANNVNGTGSFATGAGAVLQQGNGWGGNFGPGDWVNYTTGSGKLKLNFDAAYNQIGAQIQANYYGDFTAQICDNLGACFTENGTSTGAGDNSAIYLGIFSATPISWITYELTDASLELSQFAINDVTLVGEGITPVPEPGTLLLLGTGLAGLAGALKNRFARSH